MKLNINEDLAFSATTPEGDLNFNRFADRIGDGFNDHGVRENYDEDGDLESVDVVYRAMEPGPPEDRNGVRIAPEFLEAVAEKDYGREPPHLMDHEDRNSRAKIGDVKQVWYDDHSDGLFLMARVPNTGAPAHDEAIARYTHEPPSWRDGSVGLGQNYEAVRNDDGEPELRDGKLREFSTVNFPGGYDEGGVAAAFAEAAEEAAAKVDDEADASENSAAVQIENITF